MLHSCIRCVLPTWSGAQPRPKKAHVPSSNGCGTTMIQVHIDAHSYIIICAHMPLHNHTHMLVYICNPLYAHIHAHTYNHTQHTVLRNSLLLQVDISAYPGMHKCCNGHDKCYDTCNKEKAECDNDFQTCMAEYCTTLKSRRLERECSNAAGLMFTGTAVFGCDSYLESQKQACDCSYMPRTSGRLKRGTKEGL